MASSTAKWTQVQLMLRDGVSFEYAMATLVDFTPMWALQMVHNAYLNQRDEAVRNPNRKDIQSA
jgi:ligand-binding SRPBCC domain-containing protein